MARLLLSDASDWHLKFPDDQDVRGFRVLDAQRNDTGRTVRDMVIDTDAELVSHIVFSDGTEFPAADLSIGDGVVFATTESVDDARRTSDVPDYGRVHRRSGAGSLPSEDVGGGASAMGYGMTGDDDSAYRVHYGSAFGTTGRSYEVYRPAYEYGRQARSSYGDRDFTEVESSLRSDYESRYGHDGDNAWDHVKDAVRHAYDRARDAVT